MHFNLLESVLLAILTLSPASYAKPKQPKDAILLSNVKSLTLRAGQKTAHRRVSAIPQLKCSGPGCKHYTIDVMRCTNQGADYNAEDVQWSCTTNLPEDFKLGGTDVICEGYSSPDDDFVLKGSCGVEYRLLLTDKGEEKYGGSFWGGTKSKNKSADEWDLSSVLFMLVFFGVMGWILYSIWVAWRGAPAGRLPRRPGGYWGGGWGGGGPGGGDPWDPPPPYPGKPYSARQQGWQPGFWSGVLGGAAAGYMAGNRGQRQQEPAIQRGSSWFGGSSMGAPSRPCPPSSSSSSSARHESTGFGSTRRR